MKKVILYVFTVVFLSFSIGCKKEECPNPINSSLKGKWKHLGEIIEFNSDESQAVSVEIQTPTTCWNVGVISFKNIIKQGEGMYKADAVTCGVIGGSPSYSWKTGLITISADGKKFTFCFDSQTAVGTTNPFWQLYERVE